MKPASTFTQLGTIARDCLADGQHGKVLAVFSKAIYLLTEADELFWITAGDALMHRRCAQVSQPLPKLLAGSLFHVQNHHLMVAPDFLFEIADPPLWAAPRMNQVLEIAALSTSVHSFFSQLDASQAKGFGHFIPQILSLTKNESTKLVSASTDSILQFCHLLVFDVVRACLEKQPSRITPIADKLIGLGAGLTPSGDDFLGGLSFAIQHLKDAYPALDFTNSRISIESYRSRTHPISFALLKDHASGHAVEPLHHILNGILGGHSFESMSPSVMRLLRIGHSTGWDLLTGLLTGLLATYPIHYFNHSLQTTLSIQS
ncbi:MAG: DUF2877 domain-containing protein [Chloroflexi bacterium CFX2]|nr:DUF2877 domain-containing protein [Chloroflexi bacterium CFX2]